jgi:cytochrome c556
MLKKTAPIAFTALLAVTFAASNAFASDDGEIKYRQSVMKSIGGHMGAMAGIIKGETGNTGHLQLHAYDIAALSMIVPDLFPKGSDFGAETKVLPAVWNKPQDFAAAVKEMQDAATGMAAAAKTNDMAQAGAAFGKLGKACKNCHENFREKKQQ